MHSHVHRSIIHNAKVWQQAKYLSMGEWINKVVCEGTYAYLWLIHVDVLQKPTQFRKAIILQLKNKLKKFFKVEVLPKKEGGVCTHAMKYYSDIHYFL